MLSTPTTAIHLRLFQPWQPTSSASARDTQVQTAVHQPEYIELPRVNHYQELELHSSFPAIKSQFLSDIQELKRLAPDFVNQQYDKAIDAFHDKLKSPPEHLGDRDSLLPLYRETRFQIRQLVMQIKNADSSADHKAYIASVLHDCLNGIEYCPAGVHSRFTQGFLNLEASRAGLSGTLFKVRNELFHQFIQSFLFEQQREGRINIVADLEIHWFNSFHNLYCEPLGLPTSVDPLAPTNLSDDLTQRFLSAAPLSVNACSILRKISAEWSDRLRATLTQMGVSAWETDGIEPTELTTDRTGVLESTLFKPVNHLLKTAGEQLLDFWAVIEETGDGSYRLDRYREKLLAWVATHFCESSAKVFTPVPGGVNSASYIGTINELFFWVFDQDQCLPAGQACTFKTDNHTTLVLPHLTSIDFSTWSEATCHALLTQAMEQTDKAEDIASFFLQQATVEQLGKTPQVVVKALSNQLSDKLVHNDSTFKERLCQCVCDQLTSSSTTTVSPGTLCWLIDTPLLGPVLSRLQQQGIDISAITQSLASWQISDLSDEDIKNLLTPGDCQRLFRQAVNLKQAETMSRLLLTGHCDQLTSLLNDERVSPLGLFARLGILSGLEYLLKLENTEVNHKETYGFTPLNIAARYGRAECVKVLLTVPGILVNEKAPMGFTPLNSAASYGHAECVKALLAADDILVNEKNNDHLTPLNCAARKGHAECVKALLTVPGILVNEKTPMGFTPLNSAASYGHAECVKALLAADDILVNEKNNDHLTPLNCAARKGHAECVKALLTVPGILVNEKTPMGFTPLNSAAKYGHAECVKALLTAPGILVNEKTPVGLTPLNCTARYGHAECVKALLAADGVLVNEKSNDHWTPLNSAARYGHAECVKALLAADGVLVNEKNNDHWTPLNCAARCGYAECVKALLTFPGILVNEKNNDHWTPLNSAAREGHAECVKALLAADGVLVNEKNNDYWTPLNCAARYGYAECVKALLTFPGILVNEKTPMGFTPLNSAARHGYAECVKALLTVDSILVNKTNGCYHTALISSVEYQHIECVRLLINDVRTNLNKLNMPLDTALTKARKKGLTEIVNLIKADSRHSKHLDRLMKILGR